MRNKEEILKHVLEECDRQDKKWGPDRKHHPAEWLMILGEEVGEANKAALEHHFKGLTFSNGCKDYRDELIQIAAVAMQMINSLDIE